MIPEGVEIRRLDLLGRANDPFDVGQIPGQDFGNRERVHVVQEISAHQTVTAAPVDIHAAASCHHDAGLIRVGIEEAFQKLFPTRVFVQLIEEEHRGSPG